MDAVLATPALQRFVDDEILRAPLLAEQVIEGAADHIRQALPAMQPRDRMLSADLLNSLLTNRQSVVNHFTASLRDQSGPRSHAPEKPARELRVSLALVDEDEVAVDVEISHAIETVRSVAEYELRELQTFTSALVGDMDVARDHNPLGAEAYARALWAGAKALPLARGYQLAFLRHATGVLAQVLRKAFAGASSRLEAQGVEPAAYRTLILPSGNRRTRAAADTTFHPDLQRIRDSMPVRETPSAPSPPLEQVIQKAADEVRRLPPETDHAARGRLREQHRAQLVESAATRADQQSIELLSRLFDAILADQSIASDIRLLLSRLQAPALRVALNDPRTLDKEDHPLWQFVDRLAFFGEILPAPGQPARDRVQRFLQSIVEHLAAEPQQTAALYQWALERLRRHEQRRLEERCSAVAQEIADLQQLELRLASTSVGPSTMSGALDIAQFDTVPADLIDSEPAPRRPAAAARQWLDARQAGDWLRIFMQGRWVHAQLLWPGEQGELWLLGDGATSETWAVRRRALETLHNESLLASLQPRALVREAAKRVMRQMAR